MYLQISTQSVYKPQPSYTSTLSHHLSKLTSAAAVAAAVAATTTTAAAGGEGTVLDSSTSADGSSNQNPLFALSTSTSSATFAGAAFNSSSFTTDDYKSYTQNLLNAYFYQQVSFILESPATCNT